MPKHGLVQVDGSAQLSGNAGDRIQQVCGTDHQATRLTHDEILMKHRLPARCFRQLMPDGLKGTCIGGVLEIGRESGRERVCRDVEVWVGAESLKKTKSQNT